MKYMRFDVITVFPEAFLSYIRASIIKRAQARGLVNVHIHNLRDFTSDKHKSVDDKSYGGGPGMVIKIEPLARALGSILKSKTKRQRTKVILFSAAGKQFNAKMASALAKKYDHIVMLAGHYEGVDERIKAVSRDLGFRAEEISIGPYVLTGGELPAMTVIDAVSRHIPGVLGKKTSLEETRYGVGVPVYTRPEVFRWQGKNYRVPGTLLSGDHGRIEKWRKRHKQ